MPIYEYHCNSCGSEFEEFMSISVKAPKVACPQCGSKRTKRMISQTSFQLKGSGWYVTDYAGKKPPPASTESSTEKPKAESKDKKEKKE